MTTKLPALAILAILSPAAFGQVVDEYNGSAEPSTDTWWGPPDIGWYYSPSTSYSLTEIDSKFSGQIAGRTVTVGIYTDDPYDGGTLLASGSFAPTSDWSGATFGGVSLSAGKTYFVGFENVDFMFNGASAGTIFPVLRFGYPAAPFESTDLQGYAPILRFSASAVPEPTSAMALAVGGVFLSRRGRRASKP